MIGVVCDRVKGEAGSKPKPKPVEDDRRSIRDRVKGALDEPQPEPPKVVDERKKGYREEVSMGDEDMVLTVISFVLLVGASRGERNNNSKIGAW